VIDAIAFVLAFSVTAIVLSTVYFRRFRITRPPIGVFNLRDLSYMMVCIILIPFLYLALPVYLVAALLILSTASLLYFVWEPIVRVRWITWLTTVVVLGSDIWVAMQYGASSQLFSIVNDVVNVVVIVGITNIWAQSGMKARDVAILSCGLMIYDFTATSLTPLMGDMMQRLAGLPLSPQVSWGVPHSAVYASIGLGDLLLAAVFPMIMRKAYGPMAGYVAITVSVTAILGMFAAPIGTVFPAMIVLGPLAVVQYVYWSRRLGPERTTQVYLRMEPM
jgi:hypothetical protein